MKFLFGCHSSWSFEADTSFEKKTTQKQQQKNQHETSDHKKISNPKKNLSCLGYQQQRIESYLHLPPASFAVCGQGWAGHSNPAHRRGENLGHLKFLSESVPQRSKLPENSDIRLPPATFPAKREN